MAVETVKEIFDSAIPETIKNKPDLVDKINSTYKFSVSGDDGGTWLVDLTEAGGKITEGDGEAKCTITIAGADLVKVVNGELNAQMAFMSGKLKVAGDMGLAMKLTQLFS